VLGAWAEVIGALTLDGLEALFTVEGAANADIFAVFIEEVLADVVREDDIVVMDYVRFHLGERITKLIEELGAEVLLLPPYSPELNPIEECWSKVKSYLRKVAARTQDELQSALKKVMGLIIGDDARGWFRHSGFAVST